MKEKSNLIRFFAVTIILFLITAISISSQSAEQDTSSTAFIFNSLAGINLSKLFSSLGALAGAVLVITSIFKKMLKCNDTVTIIISGVISLALSTFGYFTGLGIYSGLNWIYALIYGGAAMLIANGLSTWNVISSLLTFFKLKIPVE
jgi:hypothetical protein